MTKSSMNRSYFPQVVESALHTIDNELRRCHWNKNQQELNSPFDNTGNTFKTDVFEVEAYNWGDPEHWWNFKYKNFEAAWYKHLSRGFEYKMVDDEPLTLEFLEEMIEECCKAIEKHYKR